MWIFLLTTLSAAFAVLCVRSDENITQKTIKYRRCQLKQWCSELLVNNNTEQIVDFHPVDHATYPAGRPARITVQGAERADLAYPLFVTASQQSSTQSWQVPMKIDGAGGFRPYHNFSRTLCPSDSDSPANWPLVHLSTESEDTFNVELLIDVVEDFDLPLGNVTSSDGWTEVHLSTNRPRVYAFRFPEQHNISKDNNNTAPLTTEGATMATLPKIMSPQTVILMLESNASGLCAFVSVQNLTCPIFDDQENVKHKGEYFTMLDKGGITISQAHYPVGFYVVLLLKASDEECTGADAAERYELWEREDLVRLKVVPTISYRDYVLAATALLAGILAYLALLGVAAYAARLWREPLVDSVVLLRAVDEPQQIMAQPDVLEPSTQDYMDSARHTDGGYQADTEEILPRPAALFVPPSLADLCLLDHRARKSRSDKYLWGVAIVAVFYYLPAVQLVTTYQADLQRTGDQDLCYYNFLCSHPLGLLSDFNHVYSNIGYVVLGTVFLLVVRRRENMYNRLPALRELGIPQHFGMYYAIGVSLIVEGFLSATYHFCPNKMNFQFDSSFMYAMSVYCMVMLYQSRHPDVNAPAHATLAVLACIFFLAFSEVLFTYSDLETYMAYWLAFLGVKLAFVLWMSWKIYYLGDWHLGFCVSAPVRTFREIRAGTFDPRPRDGERFYALVFMNLANLAFDTYGYVGARSRARDVPVHLLQVLLLNTILYTMIYIRFKLRHGERVTLMAFLSLAVSNVVWAGSLYFFVRGRTKWAWKPAHSRGRNAPCSLLQFYDTHDIWHLTSAVALFHTFCVLLAIDDDIAYVDRRFIKVF